MMKVNKKTILNAKTSTTVSEPICVRYAKRVTFSFKRTHTSGDAVFRIQASINGRDGDYHSTVNMIKNQPNNATQQKERIISVSLNATTLKALAALDLEDFAYDYIQVSLVENGVGTSTVKAIIVE